MRPHKKRPNEKCGPIVVITPPIQGSIKAMSSRINCTSRNAIVEMTLATVANNRIVGLVGRIMSSHKQTAANGNVETMNFA